DLLARLWHELMARPDGPFAVRFYLQPFMATLAALRDGRKDARAGRPPFGWALVTTHDPRQRRALLRDAWRGFGKIFLIALLLDLIYQIVVLKGLRPVAGLIVAIVLAVIPYMVLRGIFSRMFRSRLVRNRNRTQ
ncbi:MAG: hypothetical protein L0271_17310, partial [Gemmatimonadetes bacterium]|nr:hypothetical protein [Gemmatimonadota bacterium]